MEPKQQSPQPQRRTQQRPVESRSNNTKGEYTKKYNKNVLFCRALSTKRYTTSERIELSILRLTVSRLNQLGHEVLS
ncbi:uncharacterized protein ASCRUDRAFT_74992, partial [Ascoidea rubescens DSM 1968]